MTNDSLRSWMWSEACEMLARAERLHRQFFEPRHSSGLTSWEPPVDVLETALDVVIFVALPGVSPDEVRLTIEGDYLAISGTRRPPRELRTATIHRLELPQSQFFRRVAIPSGRYGAINRSMADGCLVITLSKEERALG